MHSEKKDKHFINKPIYEGGTSALKAFIASRLKYPVDALKNKIEGTVYLKYTIDYKGNVIDSKVISGLSKDCDNEAQRLVSLLKFKVKKPKGIKVKFHKKIQIHFKLPKENTVKVNYSYASVKPIFENTKENTSESYIYTINLPPD